MRDIYASEVGLLAALHTIQEECQRHDDSCAFCPFQREAVECGKTVECGIRYRVPEKWEINDDMNWRAFK